MVSTLSVGVEVVDDGLGLGVHPRDRHPQGIAGLVGDLESAGAAYWIIGAERGEAAGRRARSLDPSLVATVAARHSNRIGLVVAAAAHRDHPYNLARRLVSVDHAAHGRVGWLALNDDYATALDATADSWTGAVSGTAHTDDAIAAVRTLWRTWPLESVVGDRSTGVFADTAQIRRADVRRGYSISGPLNVPGSVQGDLPIWQQRTVGRERGNGGDGVDAGDVDVGDGEADFALVEEGDPLPDSGAVVVRVRPDSSPDVAIDRLAERPNVVGVVLRVRVPDGGSVVERAVAAARRRSVSGGHDEGTLRARLGLAKRPEPDLSGHQLAFGPEANLGVRL